MSVNASAFDSLLPMPQDGASLYTWMKYADDAQGNGMSDSPEGKAYVGFAYNKPTPEESDNPGDYKWQKVEGDKGDDGEKGEKGDKGDKGDDGEKGDPGDTPITMFIDKTVLFVPVDPDSGATLSTRNFSLIIRLQHGNYFDALGGSSISTLSWTTDNNTSTTMISHILASDSISSMFSVVVAVPSGQVISKRIKEISFTLKHVYAGTVYGKVQVEYVQRGIVGPAGKTIPQPYSCGWWNVDENYVVKNNYAPLVGYPKCANPLYYVRTENALKLDSGGYPLDPKTDYATYGGNGAWLLFEKYAALFVEMLMVNWARFGNAEGGVFWAHYLFSAMGIPAGGCEVVDYSAFVDGDTPMFDDATRLLTGAFNPNLFLDFKFGEVRCNRMSEPFVRMDGYFKKIRLQESHNVCIPASTALTSSSIRTNLPKILFMPNPADIVSYNGTVLVDMPYMVDGTNSCILLQSNNGIQNLKQHMTWGDGGNYDIRRFLTVLCADGRISDAYSYRETSSGFIGYHPDKGYTTQGVVQRYSDVPAGYFYVGGMFTKFLLLAPGDMVRLKSCYVPYATNDGRGTIDVLAWFVDNSDNFENVPLYLHMQVLKYYDDASESDFVDCDEEVLFDCTSPSEAFYGAHTAYGSKFVASKMGGSELDMTFILEDSDTIIPQDI